MPDSARERILGRVKQAVSALPDPANLPDYETASFVLPAARESQDLWQLYVERTERVHGRTFDAPQRLADYLVANGHLQGYCDADLLSALRPYFEGRCELTSEFDRHNIDRYAFGITRAAGLIAESGSVILADAQTPRLPALTPWVHVAVVSSESIYRDIPAALMKLGDDPNVIWCTGPSKTADVEGILIEGVHGPGEQITLCWNV